ncbi:hypothetical protein ITI46_34055 [Streptomyces oryzae]|uniref:Uncharacterized protein n=1 Tax=Streptomyces oryzae TaxID=1434886 RepID=A0ABS3XMI3_9ACTN|nr:hypothetical protein [Streptomyces oryzae]MBO8196617.1 hypothetical protein [Streptomyces oryzae]
MSKPHHLRRPAGNARGGSVADKDRRAAAAQTARREELLERMRRRNGAPRRTET